jgi:hypothetical protein
MPHFFNAKFAPVWQDKLHLLNYVPDVMLVDPTAADNVVTGFKAGAANPAEFGFGDVPWAGWYKTLLFWLPLIGLSYVATIALITIVHEQWSKREHLRYPVAYVASELISGSGERAFGSIFRNKLFWMGFASPAVILMINGLGTWYRGFIQVPLSISLVPLATKWPEINSVPGTWLLLAPTLYFSAVGFAYFVSTDVSFSLGITTIFFSIVFLFITNVTTIDVSGGHMTGNIFTHQRFGSYLGVALVILYTGRRFYWSVLSRAFGARSGEPVERSMIWSFWVGLGAIVAMIAMLVFVVGLDVFLAIGFVGISAIMFLVLTRINVETGLFMIQPGWAAGGILILLMGSQALGPNMLIILGLLTAALVIDPLTALMPLAANGLKLAETENIRPPRLSKWLGVAVLLALVVGVTATVFVQYRYGGSGQQRYGWADSIAQSPFNMLITEMPAESDPDVFHQVDWRAFSPSTKFMTAAGIGLALALGLSMMRLRFTWWPLHPVLFLVWGTFPLNVLAPSFLLGWLLKVGVTSFGGGSTYRTARPIFVGLIAGEFAAAIFWVAVGTIYYLQTGQVGEAFKVFPS